MSSNSPDLSKHTPGEWFVNKRRNVPIGPESFEVRCRQTVIDKVNLGLLIAKINYGMADVEANAALIASAPSLLAENKRLREALENLLTELSPAFNFDPSKYSSAMREATAALKSTEE